MINSKINSCEKTILGGLARGCHRSPATVRKSNLTNSRKTIVKRFTMPPTREMGSVRQEGASSIASRCSSEILPDGSSVVVDRFRNIEGDRLTALIGDAVTKGVFPHKKFIQHDSELDFGGKIQVAVCMYLLVEEENAKAYWTEERRELARKKLTKKRNNVSEQVKKTMIGKLNVVKTLVHGIMKKHSYWYDAV